MRHWLIFVIPLFALPARAHVGGRVTPAQFTSPPALISASDGGVAGLAFDVADASYTVAWQDGDLDPTGRYYFYYTDHAPQTGLMTEDARLASVSIPEGASGFWNSCTCTPMPGLICPDIGTRECPNSFVWNTSAVPPGAYYILAINNDPPFYVHSVSESPVRIGHGGTPPPGAMFLAPNGVGSADASYRIRWVANGDGPLKFDLAWGPNVYPGISDLPTSIAKDVAAVDEGNGVYHYDWDTTRLKIGEIYVQLKITDAQSRSTYTDSAALTIFHSGVRDASVDLSHAATPDLSMTTGGSGGCEVGSDGNGPFAVVVALALVLLLVVFARRRA